MVITRFPFLVVALAAAGGLLSGCCSSAKCLDSKSSLDKVRVKARKLSLGVVHNDNVSSPKRDRTDWKYVEVPKPGKLSVQLHWDNGKAKLTLGVYDVLGMLIQEGRAWGSGGLRSVIAVEEAGRYYIRVRARGKRDESHYSLRLMFRADKSGEGVCHDCKVGDRKCLGQSSYVICARVGPECNAWKEAVPCPGGSPCQNGQCAGCAAECSEGDRQCANGGYQVCTTNASGCPVWGSVRTCGRGKRCRGGRCGRGRGGRPPPVATPQQPRTVPKDSVKAKIISIYRYRGRMTLHLEIGKNDNVKPGQLGVVLDGNSDKALPDGEIKVLRVAGRFAIATTSLDKLGKNRWVKIKTN